MAKPQLYYFNSRGLGETIRYIFVEKQVDYEDIRFERSEEEAVSAGLSKTSVKDIVFEELDKKGYLDFNQVPVLLIDGHHLVQSDAIAQYVARKYDLYGKDNHEAYVIAEILGGIQDIRAGFRAALIGVPEETRNEVFATYAKEQLPKYLGFLENILKRNNGGDGYLVGNDVTLGDFALLGLFDIINSRAIGALDHFPKLKGLQDRVASRPNIAAWRARRPNTRN
eukprot:TRINITY_DN234_c0_g2_i1.p1 TRINITY_DN234_c0_g2~~TRINITY_DN234_c0_g2_i1.p1  ORF type:complete len:225 (-),score=39.51 TRINITY_DN234_c0_g2_i1:28-702(-)